MAFADDLLQICNRGKSVFSARFPDFFRRFWVREKREGGAMNEEGERVPLLASPSRAVSLLHSLPPLPFERLPRMLEIIKLFYHHIHIPS